MRRAFDILWMDPSSSHGMQDSTREGSFDINHFHTTDMQVSFKIEHVIPTILLLIKTVLISHGEDLCMCTLLKKKKHTHTNICIKKEIKNSSKHYMHFSTVPSE